MLDEEEVLQRIEDIQEFTSKLNDHIETTFRIDNKTLKQWKSELKIKFPEDINFHTIIELSKDIAKKFQIASYYRDRQTVYSNVLEQTKTEKYNKAYQTAQDSSRKDFGKNLAADSCKIAASIEIQDLENVINTQRVVKEFWIKTCDTLSEMRKHVEIISYALSADSRIQRDVVVTNYKGESR
jgi:hypothetical protein